MAADKTLLLVRHPETVANADLRYLGRSDRPYTDTGHLQAAAVAQAIAAWRPDLIVTSPLRRALQPARRARSAVGCPLRVDTDLVEFDVGAAEGLTHQEGIERGVIDEALITEMDATPFAGGESTGAFVLRCRRALDRLLHGDAQRSAVVSHQGPLRLLITELLGSPPEQMWGLSIAPAAAATVTVREGRGVLQSLDTLHP